MVDVCKYTIHWAFGWARARDPITFWGGVYTLQLSSDKVIESLGIHGNSQPTLHVYRTPYSPEIADLKKGRSNLKAFWVLGVAKVLWTEAFTPLKIERMKELMVVSRKSCLVLGEYIWNDFGFISQSWSDLTDLTMDFVEGVICFFVFCVFLVVVVVFLFGVSASFTQTNSVQSPFTHQDHVCGNILWFFSNHQTGKLKQHHIISSGYLKPQLSLPVSSSDAGCPKEASRFEWVLIWFVFVGYAGVFDLFLQSCDFTELGHRLVFVV